jgi:beta-galactosidase
MDNLSQLHFVFEPCEGPCFHRLSLMAVIADTYLDTTGLHKGIAWINQRPLGRFWSVGPQHTLLVPAPWLHRGPNEVVFFDLLSEPSEPLKTTDKPIFDRALAHRQ